MNPAHVKQDREDLMADPLRALFAPESPAVPWWYPIWLRTLPLRWRVACKVHPPVYRAVLISDFAEIVVFPCPRPTRAALVRLLKRKLRGALWGILAIVALILVVFLALAIPDWGMLP
jgi:hypothetical protein